MIYSDKMTETSDKIAARGALLDFYSDRCVAFGGFFIAAIFGLLTVLSLVQGIDCRTQLIEIFFIGLSVPVYGLFGYIGLYILKGFSHYASIADILEGGRRITGDLRDSRYVWLPVEFDQNGNDLGLFATTNLAGPTNIWFNDNDDLLIIDYLGAAVKRFDTDGNYLNNFITGLGNAEGVGILPNGNILIGKESVS